MSLTPFAAFIISSKVTNIGGDADIGDVNDCSSRLQQEAKIQVYLINQNFNNIKKYKFSEFNTLTLKIIYSNLFSVTYKVSYNILSIHVK